MKEATSFVLYAIQDWGASPERRIKAVQDVLFVAGFKAKATCWPVFGGIWPKACEGENGEAATAWLQDLTKTMPRGHFEDEEAHVIRYILAKRGEATGSSP